MTIASYCLRGRDYVFECNALRFNATRYDGSFGDGHSWSDVMFDDTCHVYASPGDYTVSCTAKNGLISRTGTLEVQVR